MNDAERNKTVSWIVTIAIGLLVAVLVGMFLGAKSHFRKGFGLDGTQALAIQRHAFISPDTNNPSTTCTQRIDSPTGPTYARPAVSYSNHDTLTWYGGTSTDRITVTFQNSGAFGPFSNTTYTTGVSSGPPTGGQNDYNFTSITIVRGDTTFTCTNYQGMGVHVDQ